MIRWYMLPAYFLLAVWLTVNTFLLVASVRERNAYGIVMTLLLFIPWAIFSYMIVCESIR